MLAFVVGSQAYATPSSRYCVTAQFEQWTASHCSSHSDLSHTTLAPPNFEAATRIAATASALVSLVKDGASHVQCLSGFGTRSGDATKPRSKHPIFSAGAFIAVAGTTDTESEAIRLWLAQARAFSAHMRSRVAGHRVMFVPPKRTGAEPRRSACCIVTHSRGSSAPVGVGSAIVS